MPDAQAGALLPLRMHKLEPPSASTGQVGSASACGALCRVRTAAKREDAPFVIDLRQHPFAFVTQRRQRRVGGGSRATAASQSARSAVFHPGMSVTATSTKPAPAIAAPMSWRSRAETTSSCASSACQPVRTSRPPGRRIRYASAQPADSGSANCIASMHITAAAVPATCATTPQHCASTGMTPPEGGTPPTAPARPEPRRRCSNAAPGATPVGAFARSSCAAVVIASRVQKDRRRAV